MLRTRLLPTAIAFGFALADFSSAIALPTAPDAATKVAASSSQVQLVRFAGRGGYRGGFVAHRGYGFRGGGMYAGRWGGRYGYGRYGYRRYGWGAAAAGLGVAAATSPYWYGGYRNYNCGPYQYYDPNYGCVNR